MHTGVMQWLTYKFNVYSPSFDAAATTTVETKINKSYMSLMTTNRTVSRNFVCMEYTSDSGQR